MAGGKLVLLEKATGTAGKTSHKRGRRGRNAKRRAQGRSINTRWFKDVTTVPSSSNGEIFNVYRARDLTSSVGDLGVTFRKYASFWTMYRVTRIVIKFFPVGRGSESMQDPNTGFPLFKRGDLITWIDQGGSAQSPPAGINQVIGKGSARLRMPRNSFKLYTRRPNNYPIWGDIDGTFAVPQITFVDPWNPSLVVYGDNFTPSSAPGSQIWFWAMAYYKVEFKGQKH